MSVDTDTPGSTATALSDYTILSDSEGPDLSYQLADDLTLAVSGATEPAETVSVTARYDPTPDEVLRSEHPLAALSLSPAQLGSEHVRARFESTVTRLYPNATGEIEDRLAEAFADLSEQHRNGRLLILDETAQRILKATRSVTYRPTASTEWLVEFDFRPTPDSPTDEIGIDAETWASPNPGAAIDTPSKLAKYPMHSNPGRWASVREVWQAIAERED